MLETKFVAKETKATNRPSGLTEGLKLSPFPGFSPSADMETSWVLFVVKLAHVALVQAGSQNTWRVVPVKGAEVTRFVAKEVNAMNPLVELDELPAGLFMVGSKLGPFAAPPSTEKLCRKFAGVQLV
jgi:hypothetical protein